jgi:uncharacterized protein (TIGR02270 family)
VAADRLTEIAAPAQYVVDDSPYLWLAREVLARGPNARLIDLARHDERLEAYLDATRVHREAIGPMVQDEFDRGGAAAEFLLVSLKLTTGDFASIVAITEDATQPPDSRPMVAALAWAERDLAGQATDLLRRASPPLARSIGIAALGARRSDPGASLTAALADPSPLVRARAYRTTGQLGRADLMAQLRPGLTDEDPECRFWSAWAAARMGAGEEALNVLADIAWNNLPRADRALDLLLRRLDLPQANAWLREFAKLPGRQRALIRATGVIGDPLYIPWLIERMNTLEIARLAGEAFSMITGLDLAYRDLDRKPPQDFQSGPNDDPADENVALDEDENLPWPDPEKIGQWWTANRGRFTVGTPYFLGTPKPAADWLEALSDAFQRQRHAAALELAIRQPDKAMFEVRARGRLQRQLIARARGLA